MFQDFSNREVFLIVVGMLVAMALAARGTGALVHYATSQAALLETTATVLKPIRVVPR
jgi:hypothetical protein